MKNVSVVCNPLCLMILLLLVFSASCNSGGATSGGDGVDGDYAGYEPVEGPDGFVQCTTDEDCWNAGLQSTAVCIEQDGFKICALPTEGSCEEICNKLCCYCQGEDCICSGCGNEDGDEDEPISNGASPSYPEKVDVGAVPIFGEGSGDISICNDGEGTLLLNDDIRFESLLTPEENQSDTSEFSLEGQVPSADNVISLAYGDCADIKVIYRPENPGRDWVNILIPSNAKLIVIKAESRLKGNVALVVECDDEIDAPDGNGKCCLAPLTHVKEMGVLELTIKNAPEDPDSNATLVIEEISLDETDAIYDIDRGSIGYGDKGELWIAPGQQDKISVVFQPDDAVIYYNKVMIPHNDGALPESDGKNPFPVRICGLGTSPDLKVLPDNLDFGVVPINGEQTINIKLANRGAASSVVEEVSLSPETDDEIFILNLDPDNDLVANLPGTLGPSEETAISLSCRPVEGRSYVGTLQIQTAFNPGGNTIVKPIICTGITSEMRVWPSAMDFGSVRVGSCLEKEATIQNYGQADLLVESVQVCRNSSGNCDLSSDFALASFVSIPLRVSANDDATIEVEYCPSAPGADQAYLRIVPEEGAGSTWVVPLSGNGVEPAICLSKSLLTWDDVQLPADTVPEEELANWRECQELTITNCGTMALEVGEIKIPSTVTSEFMLENHENHPNELAPGGSFTFNVCYLPESIGSDNGMAVICSSAANASGSDSDCSIPGMVGHEVPLMADAINPRLEVYPLSCNVNFGKVQVEGESAQETIILRNIGNGDMQISSIGLLSDMPQLGFSIVEIVPDPSTWLDGVYTLTENQSVDFITINVKYDPVVAGPNTNYLVISHSDKNAACLGQDAGAQYPDMFINLYGTSESNSPPVAVAKSPVNTPAGQFGSLTRTVNVGSIIDLDGTASYDMDDDINTPIAEDDVVSYQWSSSDTGFTFIGATNVALAQARFDNAGQYTIKLAVKDTRDAVSVETPISKLTIFVRQAPIADIKICEGDEFEGETYADVEIPRQMCFDGSGSSDDAGPISSYIWYVQENWPTGNILRYDGSSTFNYNFVNAGEHKVYLVVTDKDGVPSSTGTSGAPFVHVSAIANETLRIEMSWIGGGDVNLHYVRPGGNYKSPMDDCWANNQGPVAWSNSCGYPRMLQASTTGTGGEVEEIDHSQGGILCNTSDPSQGGVGAPYRIVVQNVKALRSCHIETTTYYDDCDRCGCSCFLCEVFDYCCDSCSENETVCENIPANITLKLYVNGASYPKYMKNFIMTEDEFYSGGTRTVEFPLHRYNGQWQTPWN